MKIEGESKRENVRGRKRIKREKVCVIKRERERERENK